MPLYLFIFFGTLPPLILPSLGSRSWFLHALTWDLRNNCLVIQYSMITCPCKVSNGCCLFFFPPPILGCFLFTCSASCHFFAFNKLMCNVKEDELIFYMMRNLCRWPAPSEALYLWWSSSYVRFGRLRPTFKQVAVIILAKVTLPMIGHNQQRNLLFLPIREKKNIIRFPGSYIHLYL